jgi:hypothetical protein
MTYARKNNIPTEMITTSTKSIALVPLGKGSRVSAKELHKYVMGLVGILTLCVVTYPIAIYRVTQQEKFASSRSHVRSLSHDYKSIEADKIADRAIR